MSRRTRIFIAVVSLALFAVGGTAAATIPVGQKTERLLRGTAGPLHTKHDGIRLATRDHDSADVAVATVTFPAGGSSGWHHHPGVVLVVVRSGTVTFYDENCHFEVHNAGEAFIESSDSPGLARNEGTVDAVVEATFIVPTSAPPAPPTPLRIDDAQPEGCNVS